NHLQIITFRLQRAAGPYRSAINGHRPHRSEQFAGSPRLRSSLEGGLEIAVRSHSRKGPKRPVVPPDHGRDGETVSPSPHSSSQTSAGKPTKLLRSEERRVG